MEVPDPNVNTSQSVPETDMSKHFASTSSAVLELLKETPADPNDPDQRGATPSVPDEPVKPVSADPAPPEPILPSAPKSPDTPAPGEEDAAFKRELESIKI